MFQIDIMSRTPVYEQIISQLENFVLTGIMNAGDKIPSVRNLSATLSINPNTIQKAYSELDNRGIIYSVPGKGCFIHEEAKSRIMKAKQSELVELVEKMKQLKLAGISKSQVLECVQMIFEDGKED
ncbi:MAG: GntR family transcriptional regulator [bacterium]|nr:GntR family transcriptional regulator [bacterium]